MDQELADAAACAGKRCVCTHSPDGSTSLWEMISWPPS